jgi:hypothetical protein
VADGTGGGGGGSPPDIIWTFPGSATADQNVDGFFIHRARKPEKFVGLDLTAVIAPVGQPIIVDWEVNGAINPAFRLTLAVGTLYIELLTAISLVIDDKIRPQVVQVGNQTPGSALSMRLRGS